MSHPNASNVQSMLHGGKTMIAALAAIPVAYLLAACGDDPTVSPTDFVTTTPRMPTRSSSPSRRFRRALGSWPTIPVAPTLRRWRHSTGY